MTMMKSNLSMKEIQSREHRRIQGVIQRHGVEDARRFVDVTYSTYKTVLYGKRFHWGRSREYRRQFIGSCIAFRKFRKCI